MMMSMGIKIMAVATSFWSISSLQMRPVVTMAVMIVNRVNRGQMNSFW